ncbi:MAG: hypothetical protein ACR2JB_03990 [Bryobacteraceae bacterium]
MNLLVEKAIAEELIEVSYRATDSSSGAGAAIFKTFKTAKLNIVAGSPEELDETLRKLSTEVQANWDDDSLNDFMP